MKCINCSKGIDLVVFGRRICDSCKEEEKKEPFRKLGEKKIKAIHEMVNNKQKAIERGKKSVNEEKQREEKITEILEFLGFYDFGGIFLDYKGGTGTTFSLENIKKRLKKKEITEENVGEAVEFERTLNTIKTREKRYRMVEKVEKELYGNVKKKRISIPKDKQAHILKKFNNECSICGAKEGLHIHHKDHNPKNNRISNLIVLCGVCHKKIHMTVR